MTFKHKLSVRLALMRDALLLVPVTGLRTCDKPAQLAAPHSIVIHLAVPAHFTLATNQVGN